MVRFPNGEIRRAELHWYEAHGVGRRKMKVTSKKHVEFAICVANEGYEDLEVWKVYPILPGATAAELGCLRVIDESGEDYLYPAERFAAVDFPKIVRLRLPKWQPGNRNKTPQPGPSKKRDHTSVWRTVASPLSPPRFPAA
jgi:hypothetical protein